MLVMREDQPGGHLGGGHRLDGDWPGVAVLCGDRAGDTKGAEPPARAQVPQMAVGRSGAGRPASPGQRNRM